MKIFFQDYLQGSGKAKPSKIVPSGQDQIFKNLLRCSPIKPNPPSVLNSEGSMLSSHIDKGKAGILQYVGPGKLSDSVAQYL